MDLHGGSPGSGAFVCDIEVINKISQTPTDAIYFDFQQHLPIPQKLNGYSLSNGLTVRTENEPRDYHFHYIGTDDTEFDWHIRGLMDPFDIHDPDMDPLASTDVAKSGFGSVYANHFDMTAHFTGIAEIRGRSFDVDCISIINHSWGPRNERLLKDMGWINAHFGPDYSVHVILTLDIEASGWDAFGLAHGYALVEGRVRGLKAGKVRALRNGFFPVSYEMRLLDVDDHEHLLIGSPMAQHPWACYSNSFIPFSSMRWHAEGRIGQGIAMENWALDRLTGRDFKAGRE